jgi:hypothetical protein
MTTTDLRHARLDRAHLQGKVIATNLAHLAVVLTAAEPELREDLASITNGFAEYVRRLDRACDAAECGEGSSAVPETRPVAEAVDPRLKPSDSVATA